MKTLRSLLSAATKLTRFATAALAVLLATPAHAATLTLNPAADAYVQAGNNANKNYGSATTLRVRTNATAAKNYDSHLKFDTSSATGTVTSAKLRVYAKLSASGAVSTTAYAIATTTWGETSITWNNKPALGSALGNISVTSTSYAWKEIDVTAYVQGEFNANRKVLSFAYHSGTASSLLTTLQSREGTNKPQLVVVTNAAPTVSLTAPANNSSYVAPASVTLSANAADTDGTITSVAFYNGAILLNTDTSAPYSYTWTGVATGSYTLTAKAVDNSGAITTSSPINITVNPVPNVPPTVSLTAPANNANYTAPASVNLTANATDSDGTITKVEYYNGAALIGQATSAPYAFTWANVAAGSYTLTAKATDNANTTTTSSSISITVTANQAPSVSLLAPSASDNFTAPATFSIVANAADSDGSISLVEFYNGTTFLGSKTQNPYTYDWLNVAAGSYTLTAKAYDNANASTASAPVTITVNAPQVAAGIYYIYADHLNTPRVITDSANKTVWRWDSDPFGTDMAYEDPDGDGVKFSYNLRFPGQYFDKETGLHYNYFRDYDPSTGRYVQSDPIGLAGGINTFLYANANPVMYTDPNGLNPIVVRGLAAALAAAKAAKVATKKATTHVRTSVEDCDSRPTPPIWMAV